MSVAGTCAKNHEAWHVARCGLWRVWKWPPHQSVPGCSPVERSERLARPGYSALIWFLLQSCFIVSALHDADLCFASKKCFSKLSDSVTFQAPLTGHAQCVRSRFLSRGEPAKAFRSCCSFGRAFRLVSTLGSFPDSANQSSFHNFCRRRGI